MFSFLSNFFQKKRIDTVGVLPLSTAHIIHPRLLEQCGIADGSVILFAVPYLTADADAADRNLSSYAVSRDYHLFFAELFAELLPLLENLYPQYRFSAFSDHSPIDEVKAAARAGLGILGDNGLLITEKYASYVFLGEIITNAPTQVPPGEIRPCMHCGKCQAACPMTHGSPCLSSLTQKKGALTGEETAWLREHSLIWGCDTCQEVCPYVKRARESGTLYTPIPFFYTAPIPTLTAQTLDGMDDATFSARAYAWRKRETIGRNLKIKEEKEKC